MKTVKLNSGVVIKAIQLTPNNRMGVYDLLLSEQGDIAEWRFEPLIHAKFYGYGSKPVIFEDVYDNTFTAGLTIRYIGGSQTIVHYFDWVVVMKKGDLVHISTFNPIDFYCWFSDYKKHI